MVGNYYLSSLKKYIALLNVLVDYLFIQMWKGIIFVLIDLNLTLRSIYSDISIGITNCINIVWLFEERKCY